MGAVWRATDRLLRREVAVKEVAPPPGMPAEERDALTERTFREARAAAGLSHPSVVRVYDVVTDGGRPWIVMELLKAHSLADLIERDGALAPRAVSKIGLAMLGALEAAHKAGVLHRDVKPGNVLICADGRCVLTDFGVARSAHDSQMTSPGMVLGSPHFISPERAVGGSFGPPSDLFSLGVTLYAAVEGVAPFDRGDAIATMHAVVNDPPEPPQRAGQLTPVLYGLLEKDPAKRWDVERTRGALRGFLIGAGGTAGPGADVTSTVPAPPVDKSSTTVMPASAPSPPYGATPPYGAAPPPHGPAPMSESRERWQTGRASVQASSPVFGERRPGSGHDVRGYRHDPPGGDFGYQPDAGPGGPFQSERPLGAWVFGATAVLVAMLLVIAAVGFASGWFEDSQSPEGKPTAVSAPFEVRPYQGRGVRLNVPKMWNRKNLSGYVQFHHPDNDRAWLRVKVSNDGRPARAILRGADQNFANGCCDVTNYRRVTLRNVKLGGQAAAELEYTGVRASTGEKRHGIWRVVVKGGKTYELYMSVPQKLYQDSRPVFDEAVRSFKLAK
ncbi:MAG: protein kinase domain-containing protein [Micromonosporaceae bacterium]